MKILTATLKFITLDKRTIDSIDNFSFETQDYTSISKDIHQDKIAIPRIYVSHKIESSKTLADLKHGSRHSPSNIAHTLVKITPYSIIRNSTITMNIQLYFSLILTKKDSTREYA